MKLIWSVVTQLPNSDGYKSKRHIYMCTLLEMYVKVGFKHFKYFYKVPLPLSILGRFSYYTCIINARRERDSQSFEQFSFMKVVIALDINYLKKNIQTPCC